MPRTLHQQLLFEPRKSSTGCIVSNRLQLTPSLDHWISFEERTGKCVQQLIFPTSVSRKQLLEPSLLIDSGVEKTTRCSYVEQEVNQLELDRLPLLKPMVEFAAEVRHQQDQPSDSTQGRKVHLR
jgi:hypothetical protein